MCELLELESFAMHKKDMKYQGVFVKQYACYYDASKRCHVVFYCSSHRRLILDHVTVRRWHAQKLKCFIYADVADIFTVLRFVTWRYRLWFHYCEQLVVRRL